MKIVVIGDTHGRDYWADVVAETNMDKIDKFIFIGDYFDSFNLPIVTQLINFKKILEFKRTYPDKVILLMGNHDMHYTTNFSGKYSGYQYHSAPDIQALIMPAIEEGLLQVCAVIDGVIYTHAGVSEVWCKNNNINIDNLEDELNTALKLNRGIYEFTYGRNYSNYGDDVTQSPIWIRPNSLHKSKLEGFKQVVGHTHHDIIREVDGVWFTDVLDKIRQYLVVDDGKATIKVF